MEPTSLVIERQHGTYKCGERGSDSGSYGLTPCLSVQRWLISRHKAGPYPPITLNFPPAHELDAHECLMIRACKSNKPSWRKFRKIAASRCALETKYVRQYDVAVWMVEVAISIGLIDPMDWLERMNPTSMWKYGTVEGLETNSAMVPGTGVSVNIPATYSGQMILAVVSILRHTAVKDLPGFVSPLKWRLMD